MEGRDHSDHSCINLCVFVLTSSSVNIVKEKKQWWKRKLPAADFFDEFLEVELY